MARATQKPVIAVSRRAAGCGCILAVLGIAAIGTFVALDPLDRSTPPPAGSVGVVSQDGAPSVKTNLAFSGAVVGRATDSVALLAPTSSTASESSSDWQTQCVFSHDGSDAWSATIVVKTAGNEWSIQINNADNSGQQGNPKPGSYDGLEPIGPYPPANTLGLRIVSQHGIASYINPDTNDMTEFGYYTPTEHNNGDGAITINKGLESGTLDVWLTPITPSNLVFHIAGTWSCREG